MKANWVLPAAALSLALVGAWGCGCGNGTDSARWDDARKETKGKTEVSKEAVEGKKLNQYFPKVEAPYSFTFKTEKPGFVGGQLSKDGKDVASFAISDTISDARVKDKFANSSTNIAGYSSATSGSTGTAILVGDRFQVQVRSLVPEFSESDRKSWIEKFDLTGLSGFMP